MTEQRVKLRLSALLSVDVEGFSRMIRDDGEHTFERLKKYFNNEVNHLED